MDRERRHQTATTVDSIGDVPAGVDLRSFLPRLALSWQDDTDAPWRAIEASLVFADISGFTALSERLATRGPIGAEELTEVLGSCFAGLLAIAYAEGGSLLKFGGDALLLLFDGDGHEVRAGRAALGMRHAIRTLGRLTTTVGSVRLRMSQGVHSGTVHLFRGGGSHVEMILSGPAATEVVRMEGTADAGEIVVSPATATALEAAMPGVVGQAKGPGLLLRNRKVDVRAGDFPTAPATARAVAAAAAGVPVALRRHLAAGGGESEHRHVAIAFLHFDGTDDLLAQRGPAHLAGALDQLVTLVQEVVETEDVTFLGTDVDADGGKIILVAGAPTAYEDADGRLLRAVRKIMDSPRALAIRIGVNRGHVFSGSIGPDYRQTYTVMGDAVNLAARLMAKASPGQIVVHPDVLERSRSAFETEPLAPFLVKGKSQPIPAFTLGEVTGTSDVRRSSSVPLVGRDVALDTLLRAVADGGCVVRLDGDVGLGKSRLIAELRNRCDDDTVVRVITCEQYERSTPYFAVRIALWTALSLGPASTVDDLRDVIDHLGVDDAEIDELRRWLPLLGDAAGIAVADTEATRGLEPRFRLQRTVAVAAHALVAASPVGSVLAFDDVQWIDSASRDVVAALAGRIAARGQTLVTAGNGQGTREEAADGAEVVITLSPLDRAEGAAMAHAVAAPTLLPPHKLEAILDRAGGNPLFIEELVTMAQRSAVDDLPDSLEAVIGARVDQLDPGDRRLLRVASVLGDSFPFALFAQVAPEVEGTSANEVATRVGGALVVTGDGRLQFRHRLFRDAAYQALPFRVRRDIHGRAAQVLERMSQRNREQFAAVLSLHALHAEQFEKAWEFGLVAKDDAVLKFAIPEAVVLAERMLTAARRLPDLDAYEHARALVSLSSVLLFTGRFAEARSRLLAARKIMPADRRIDSARICARLAEVDERLGNVTSAFRWLARGIRMLDESDAEQATELAEQIASAASLRLVEGRLADATKLADRAIALAGQHDVGVALAHALAVKAQISTALGGVVDPGAIDQAIELYRAADRRENVAILELQRGAAAYFDGRWDDAVAAYERSRNDFAAIGDLVDAALGNGNIAEVFVDQGRLDEAAELLEETVRLFRAASVPVGVALATRFLARVHLRGGEVSEAIEKFEEARSTLDRFGMMPKVAEIDVWLAECQLRLFDIAAARASLTRAASFERSTGSSELTSMRHRLAACAALAEGDLVGAWTEADAALHIARERSAPYDVALALETMEALTRHGGRSLEESARRERDQLIERLGIRQRPALPVPAPT